MANQCSVPPMVPSLSTRRATYIQATIKGVVVFNPAGEVIRTFIGEEYSSIHDMEIRDEDGIEYIYGARNKAGVGINSKRFRKNRSEIGLKNESGLALTGLKPTAITVAPNGDIFLSDGYASNIISGTIRMANTSATSARRAMVSKSSTRHTV